MSVAKVLSSAAVCAALAFSAGLGSPRFAYAQTAQQVVDFQIPAQSLAAALSAFEQATGVRVEAPAALVGGLKSPGAQGQMPRDEALRRLLSGTGLTYSPAAPGVVTIVARNAGGSVRLDPIVVAAESATAPTGRAQVLESYQASKTEAVVHAETVRTYNSANNYDALRVVPGVSYLWGAGGRTGQPSRIRGALGWGITSVIDDYPSIRAAGIGAEDGGLATSPGTIIPAIALESVEVQKGGLGVLYASDADGGVIVNRIKQGRAGGPRGSVWIEANPIAEQLLMADVGGGSEDGRFDYYAAGKLLNGDYDELTDQDGDQLTSDQFVSGLGKFGWNPDADTRVEVLAVSGQDEVRYTKNQGAGDRFRTRNETSFIGLSVDRRLDSEWSYDLGYTLWLNEAERFSLTQGRAHRLRPEQAHTLYGNLYYKTALSEDIGYSAAVGVEHVNHNQQEEANNSDKEHEFRDTSLYVLNSFTLLDRIVLNAGLRFVDARDDFRDQTLLAHDLGAAYRFEDLGLTLRAAHSSGYGRNKGFVFFFGPIEQAGGVRLTETETTELGAEKRFLKPDGSLAGSVELSVFRTEYENAPNFSGWGAATVYYDDARSEGLELSGSYFLSPRLSLQASYTWLDTEFTGSTNPSGGNIGSSAVPVPRQTAALGLDWQATGKLRIESIITYDEGMRSEAVDTATGAVTVTEFDGYTRWNAAAYYSLTPRWTLFVRGENLLGDEDLGFTQTVSGPAGTTATELVAEDPGRFFGVGAILNW